MKYGTFGLKIDFEDENIIRKKEIKIDDIKKLVHQLELKFR